MALKLRLRHTLGEESHVFDEAQGVEPRVIGRARDAAVTVPSLRVAPRHCAVFFHRATGQWLLQDGNTRGGTSVNGIAMPGSRYAYPLQPMDVITLGDEPTPPTIVVEQAEAQRVVRPAAPPRVQSRVAPVVGPVVGPGGGTVVEVKTESPVVGTWFDAKPTDAGEDADALAALAAAAARRRAAPEKHSSMAVVLGAIAVALSAAAAAFGLFWLHSHLSGDKNLTTAASEAPPPVTLPSAPQESAEAPQTRPEGFERFEGLEEVELVPEIPEDPEPASPEWQAVLKARQTGSVGRQLQAYQQFLADEEAVDSERRAQVERWLEVTLDKLWWRRIARLLEAEFALTDELLEIDSALRQSGSETDPGEVERLRQRLVEARQQLNEVGFQLTEVMAYGEAETPDLTDSAQIERLRQRRDPERYAVWRREVLSYTLTTGELPEVFQAEGTEVETNYSHSIVSK